MCQSFKVKEGQQVCSSSKYGTQINLQIFHQLANQWSLPCGLMLISKKPKERNKVHGYIDIRFTVIVRSALGSTSGHQNLTLSA